MKTLKIITAFIICISFMTFAQSDDVKKLPGYFDFGNIGSLDQGDEGTEVFIEEYLLKMVAKLTKSEDEALSDLLNGLKLVTVNTFKVNQKNMDGIRDKVSSIQQSLEKKNWDKIVRVREKGEDISVYLKTDKSSKINGLVVAGFDDEDQAIFINIVGDINLETIGKLGDKFDIPTLNDIKKKN